VRNVTSGIRFPSLFSNISRSSIDGGVRVSARRAPPEIDAIIGMDGE
jgi:hypothetical protein